MSLQRFRTRELLLNTRSGSMYYDDLFDAHAYTNILTSLMRRRVVLLKLVLYPTEPDPVPSCGDRGYLT